MHSLLGEKTSDLERPRLALLALQAGGDLPCSWVLGKVGETVGPGEEVHHVCFVTNQAKRTRATSTQGSEGAKTAGRTLGPAHLWDIQTTFGGVGEGKRASHLAVYLPQKERHGTEVRVQGGAVSRPLLQHPEET